MSSDEQPKTIVDVARLLDLAAPIQIPPGELNVITICYNEALRLPHFLEFYKALGVDRFLVVDNGSTDGTAEILDAEPTVTRFFSNRSFAEYKTVWREVLADAYAHDRWVLFPDADELLIFPHWPERDLLWLTSYLEEHHYDALFAPMVDMYPHGSLLDIGYSPGTPFYATCAYFDATNYRQLPQLTSVKKWKTPPYRIHGGARERLFHPGKEREPSYIDRMLLRTLFSLRRNTNPGPRRRKWEQSALARLDGCFPDKPPNMSKVPLLRWRPGTRFQSSPHRINFEYRLAPDWATILHFKYLPDFPNKVDDAVARGQHMSQSLHYKMYQAKLRDLLRESLVFRGSRLFTGHKSLLRAGLMRESPELKRWNRIT